MVNSKQKGSAGERDLCQALMEAIPNCVARRGQQFKGTKDSPDVEHNLPGIHMECKRTETVQWKKWQAKVEAEAEGKAPAIAHRYSRSGWWIMVKVSDLPRVCKAVVDVMEGKA